MSFKTYGVLIFAFFFSSYGGCLPNLEFSNSSDTVERGGKDVALFFAFQDYQDPNLSDLKNPISDSRALAKTLAEEYGFECEILENPTRLEVLRKIEEYHSKTYSPEDQLLIFFSGHGDYDPELKEGFLIPSDGAASNQVRDSHLSMTILNKQIDELPCKHILVMIDASYSGAFDIGKFNSKGRSSIKKDTIIRPKWAKSAEAFLKETAKFTTRLYLTSGGLVPNPDGGRFSPFIGEVLKVFRAKTSDGLIMFKDLLKGTMMLPSNPQYGTFGRDDPGGDFIFVNYSGMGAITITETSNGVFQLYEALKIGYKEINSNSGVFKVGDVYHMTVELENQSDELLEEINISIDLPEHIMKNSVTNFQIKAIDSQKQERIQFSFFISDLYQSKQVGIKVEVGRKESQYVDFIETLEFKLEESDCVIPARQNKDIALIFAATDYQSLAYDTLKNPILESYAIAEELTHSYNFDCEVIENPTRQDVKQKLEEYTSKFESNTFDSTGQLLVMFTGHGAFEDGIGYFLPVDSKGNDLEVSSIPYPIWRRKIDRINCKHILVIIDACFSGAFEEEIASKSGERDGNGKWKRAGEYCSLLSTYYKFDSLKSRYYLTSGGKEETPDDSELAENFLFGLRVAKSGKQYFSIGEIYERYLRLAKPLPLIGDFGLSEFGGSFMFFVNER